MQTPENLLAGACVQLANTLSGPLPRALVGIYEGHSRLKTRPTCTEVLEVLESTVHEFDTVYLVIDALDECSEQVRDRFLTQMDALPVNTRRLVTTRNVDSIVNRYYDCPRIKIRAPDVDLKKYITARIASSNRLMRHVREVPALERAICEGVISKADGMYVSHVSTSMPPYEVSKRPFSPVARSKGVHVHINGLTLLQVPSREASCRRSLNQRQPQNAQEGPRKPAYDSG